MLRGNAAVVGAPAGATKTSPTTGFKAPLLQRLLDIEQDQRLVVLDLGSPSQAVLDRLAHCRCRIEVADLSANNGVHLLNGAESAEEGQSVITKLLPSPSKEPLNIVLCWDLPNYLSIQAQKYLFKALATRAAPGCKLHTLIVYAKQDMPAVPGRFLPLSDGQLMTTQLTAERIPAPRYSPEDLGRAVGRFRYERGVLLSNGLQEFIYEWP